LSLLTPPPAASLARMRWRCRRGMKELDLLLIRWLDARFDAATEAERGEFEALLELPDPQLADYLLRREAPEQAPRAALVASILADPRIMSSTAEDGNLR
jgi:antitoxin CptB